MNDKWDMYIWAVTIFLSLVLIILLTECAKHELEQKVCTPEVTVDHDTKR